MKIYDTNIYRVFKSNQNLELNKIINRNYFKEIHLLYLVHHFENQLFSDYFLSLENVDCVLSFCFKYICFSTIFVDNALLIEIQNFNLNLFLCCYQLL